MVWAAQPFPSFPLRDMSYAVPPLLRGSQCYAMPLRYSSLSTLWFAAAPAILREAIAALGRTIPMLTNSLLSLCVLFPVSLCQCSAFLLRGDASYSFSNAVHFHSKTPQFLSNALQFNRFTAPSLAIALPNYAFALRCCVLQSHCLGLRCPCDAPRFRRLSAPRLAAAGRRHAFPLPNKADQCHC